MTVARPEPSPDAPQLMLLPPADRPAAAGSWLARLGGSAEPVALGAALGLRNAERRAEVLRALVDLGHVTRSQQGGQHVVTLTPAGWSAYGGVAELGAGAVVDEVLSVLPSWAHAHRAFARLMLSAVIAKARLFDQVPDRHLGFASFGAPGSGKTVLARIVCGALGLDPLQHVRRLDEVSAGELRGRLGSDGALSRSELEALPFLALDERDKARDGDTVKALWRFLSAEGRYRAEGGQVLDVRPTAVVFGNLRPGMDGWGLPAGTERRAVLMSPDYIGVARHAALADHIADREAVLTPGRPLALGRLRVAPQLSADARGMIRTVRAIVAPGAIAPDLAGLEFAALGRAALLPDTTDVMAAALTVADWAACAETIPGTLVPDWGPVIAAARAHAEAGPAGALGAALEAATAGRRAALDVITAGRLAARQDADALIADRQALVAGLDAAAGDLHGNRVKVWPAERRAEAIGVRALLAVLRADAAGTRSRPALVDVATRAEAPMSAHRRLLAAERQDRESEQQARALKADAARAAAGRRQLEASQRSAAKATAVAQLGPLMDQLKTVEKLYRGAELEAPISRLSRLRVDGVRMLEFVPDAPAVAPQPPRGLVRALLEGPPPPPVQRGIWVAWTGARWPGTRGGCPALASWGPATASIVGPLLASLHADEDRLRTAAGRPARRSRPAVPPVHRSTNALAGFASRNPYDGWIGGEVHPSVRGEFGAARL